MKCPKCNHLREENSTAPAGTCPACGLIYSKYDPFKAAKLEKLRAELAAKQAAAAVSTAVITEPVAAIPEPIQTQPSDASGPTHVPANLAVCTQCEEIGQVVEKMPGNTWVEVVLYLCYLVPGIIYSVWRRKGKKQVCGACGSENLVSARTRVGKQIIDAQLSNWTYDKPNVPTQTVPPGMGKVSSFFIAALGCAALAGSIRTADVDEMFNPVFAGIGAVLLLCAVVAFRAKPTVKRIETEKGLSGW